MFARSFLAIFLQKMEACAQKEGTWNHNCDNFSIATALKSNFKVSFGNAPCVALLISVLGVLGSYMHRKSLKLKA
jgi:hypothetical protein